MNVDITSVGGAAFDVFIRAPHTVSDGQIQFPLGGKVKVESAIQSCGGGATNTSIGFARLGLHARFCGIVADDEWGQGIQKALKKAGVLTDAAIIIEGETSSFSVILVDTESGERTVLYSPNVNAHMCDPVLPKDLLRESTWLFLNHLTDVSCVILDDMVQLASEEHFFAWNPGGSQVREGYDANIVRDLLVNTDILFLNAQEAMAFTRTSSTQEALRIGIKHGASIMCITDGKNGACLSDGETLWRAEGMDVPVVDTTGAGDAFAVGITWAVQQQMPLSQALQAGMINAASVIGFVGTQAGLLTDTDMRQRLSSTKLSVHTSSL